MSKIVETLSALVSAAVYRDISSKLDFIHMDMVDQDELNISFGLYCEDGPYENLIELRHQQEFRVTVINLRDRSNDVSPERNFLSEINVYQSYIHKCVSLTDAKKLSPR